jgi:transposase
MQGLATIDTTIGRSARRLDVLVGPERRRSYSEAEKARLVAETLQPGVSIVSIAHRHGLHPQQLYTWRRQARRGHLALQAEDAAMFATVVAEAALPSQSSTDSMAAATGGEIMLKITDLRLRIGADVCPGRVAALVQALRAAG